MQELISVVMPCYREPTEIVVEALDSILMQTYKNFEIIIVMEPEYPELEVILGEYKKRHGNLIVHVNTKRQGLPKSLNLGIKMAKGRYIARMDADDLSLPWRLEWEIEYLTSRALDLVGTYYEMIHENGMYKGIVTGPLQSTEIYTELLKGNCIGHPTWLMKKEVWEKVGGYDDFPYAEDYHFLLKARKLGIGLGVMPKICIKYRRGDKEYPLRAILMAEYLGEHCEEIFDVTPERVQEYLDSVEGEKKRSDMEKYRALLSKFRNGKWSKLWYGMQMFQCSYGRAAFGRRLLRWCGKLE